MHQNVKKIDNDIKEQEQETAEDVDAAISESRDKTRQIENDLKKLKKLQKVRTYQQQQLDKKVPLDLFLSRNNLMAQDNF
tara:strand:- start:677 stop:916 length:240 start_codon:yes stop_codon:yes gene_type:complete